MRRRSRGGMAQLFPWQNIGFEVAAVFTSAREALEYIAHDPVDVVLTDIEMPDMNGLELSRRLMDCLRSRRSFSAATATTSISARRCRTAWPTT